MVFSVRPMRVGEILDALAVDVDEEPYFDDENRMTPQDFLCICASLIIVVPSKRLSEDGFEGSEDGSEDYQPTEVDESDTVR